MRKLMTILFLFLGGCSLITGPQDESYCGTKLGLTKGTTEYANCRMQLTMLHQQHNQYYQSVWQNINKNPNTQNVNVSYSPYPGIHY